MDHYSVLGNPIQQSQSPLIHRLFAEQTKQKLQYTATLVALDGLAEALSLFQTQGGKGVNITLPFKHRAFSLVDTLSERAKRAEAINTIKFNEDGTRYGDNTDGVGLVRDITKNLAFSVRKKRVLILGSGGAVRGILEPILNEKPEEVIIANRSESKALILAEQFADLGSIQALPLSLLESDSFDIVINGTSASLQGEMLDLPSSILKSDALAYDMVYGKGITPFLRWAKDQGAGTCVDGLGMLVEQAAESFALWRDVRPNTQAVLAKLKEMLEPVEFVSDLA